MKKQIVIDLSQGVNAGGVKGTKAVPKYFSIEDIVKYFDKNPDRLVEYVKSGLPRKGNSGTSIMGIHLAQLARMIGAPLLFDGQTYDALPRWSWVEPNKFKNINAVLSKAETFFPSPQ